MAFKIDDRVRETTVTTGTGTVSLQGAVPGFQTFVSAIGDNNTTYYAIVHRTADEWELGVGTVDDQTTDTLARTTVLSSSNSDSAVSFSAGVKDVFVTTPASKATLLNPSNGLTIGTGAAGVDYTLTFDGESNDGVITWMEDEDYFLFSDDILMNSTEKIQFGDTASFIQQSSNGTLRIDGEAIIDLNASTRVDVSGDIKVGGEVQTANIGFTDGDNAIVIADGGGITASTSLTLASGSTVTSIKDEDDMASDSATALATQQSIKAFVAASVTAEDLDITTDSGTIAIDLDSETLTVAGGTGLASSASSNTVTLAVDAAQTGITSLLATDIKIGEDDQTKIDFETADEIHLYAANAEQVYVADGIFGPQTDSDVDLGTTSVRWKDAYIDSITTTGNITSAGTVSFGSITDGTITATAFVDEDNMASDSATLIPTQQSVKAYVDSNVSSTSFVLEDGDGTEVTITQNKEVKFVEGGGIDINWTDTSTGSDADPYDLTFTLDAAQTGITSLLATDIKIGEDDQTKIDFETADEIHFYAANVEQVYLGDNIFGPQSDSDVDLGSTGVRWKDAFVDSVTVTGEVDAVTLDISGNADIDGTTNLDNTDIDGTLVVDGSNISLDSTSTLNIDNSNTSNGVTIGTATSGVPISIGHSTSEVTVNDNLTVTGNFTVSGTSTTVDSTTVAVADSMFKLAKDQGTSADALDFGFYGQYGVGGTAKFAGVFRDVSATGDPFTFFDDLQAEPGTTVNTSGTGYDLADIAAGGATFADNVTITGDADVDGTLEADAITVNGTALNTVIAGVTVTNATTAAVATTVTISDNESTNEDNAIIFTSGGDVDGGNIGLESDGDLIYNPSTGRLTATQLAGTLQTAAQANITSLGTLTTLTVDNVIINGSTIGHTGDTDLMTVASGILTVAGEVSMTTLDIGGTNVTSTAAELNVLDGITAVVGELNALDLGSTAVGTAIASKAVILDSNKDYTGFRNFTATGDVEGASVTVTDGVAISASSGDVTVANATSDKDLIFTVNDGGSATEVMRLDGDVSAILVASGKELRFADSGEKISGDGTDLTIASGADITLAATADVNIPVNVGLRLGDGGENIETDNTDLTITSGGKINLAATSDVHLANNIGLVFGDAAEKIEGDGTDLTITGNNIKLTAAADIVVPANVGITFGTGEKIEGDSTDLTVTSGAKINLNATSDIHIPNDVGIVFGGASEKIEGDGTDLVISANNLTVDAAADIILDAGGNDFQFKAGGTHVLSVVNSSSDVIIKPIVDAKDIIFQQRDGTEVARIEDNATFNVVTGKLAINGTAITSTAAELNILDGVTATATEINLLDGGTSVGSSITLADADGIVTNDGGTMKTIPASDIKTYVGAGAGAFAIANLDIDGGTDIGADLAGADLIVVDDGAGGTNRKATLTRLMTFVNANVSGGNVAADNIQTGDAAVTIATSSGNITIDAQANDSDIIFKGTDGSSDTTFLTIDGSAAGAATFNDKIIATELDISGNIDVDGTTNLDVVDIDGAVDMASTLAVTGIATFTDDIIIGDGKTIGSASDVDAITIAANGQLTLTQTLIGTALDISGDIDVDGTTNLDVVDIDGAVDMASTLGVTGVVTANAGVVVDNITIDGTEIDLSSGDLTLDVAGDIILDADGGDILLKDGGTQIGTLDLSNSDFKIQSNVSDKDLIFSGNDGGSVITALTLDMSDAGAATFNNNVTAFSDERLKTDIKTIESGLDKVIKMRGVTYTRNGVNNSGVIAQELEKIAPELVKTADDDMGTKSVAYGNMVGYLIEAIKELDEKLNEVT